MNYNMKVAICILVKNENRYIREWLYYHKKLGFDNIILYDNNDYDGENVFDVIGDEITNGYVIYNDIRGKIKYQLPCYNEFLNKYHKIYDWVSFLDCDEFIELRNYDNIKEWLSQYRFNNFEQILVQLEQYGDNDLIRYDDRGVIERFIQPTTLTLKEGRLFQTKPFYKTLNYKENDFIKEKFVNAIKPLYNTTCDVNGEKIMPTKILFTHNPDCIIKHYKTKTIEEYIERHKHDCYYDNNIQLIARKLKSFFEISKSNYKIKDKVEIIKNNYSWYNYYDDKCTPVDFVIVDDGNPLLIYTIKSIKKNISWYNKIFVISNNKLNIEGVTLINTNDIVPNGFENTDIPLFLHNIEELSERFIYVYSGTLFNYICFEDEFFNGNEVCMQPVNFNTIPKKYKKVCFENNKLFLNRKDITSYEMIRLSKGNFGYMFSRTCCPMLKSDNKSCFEYIKYDIEKNKSKINHLIYPTWSRVMCHDHAYIHTNVSIEECEDVLLEVEDPIYKIINIPSSCVSDNMIKILDKRYE